jgi:hypothetical protein
MPKETRKRLSPAALIWVVVAFGAGTFLRLYFISSHGMWDTEYRKAWALHTAEAGVTQSYGGPDSVPPGDFLPQLLGRKPRWEVPFRGRDYVIDYPPLALAVWGEAWTFFTSRPRPYRGAEAENLAVKFPPVLGDLLSVSLLMWAFRGDRRQALLLAAAYWMFPVTWVSSAVHGNFDGFVSPFLLLAMFLARGSPFLAGAAFAVTCLIKPTGAVALPVLFLAAPRPSWSRVVAGGVVVTILVFTPFLVAGTLETAFIHVARVFSQERISGGYANPWWLVGQASYVARDLAGWRDPIDYVRRDDFAVPVGLIGFAAAGLAGAWILFQSRRIADPRSMAYVGALLLFDWGLLTIGVHDNHNHPLFLLLVATGLGTGSLRAFTATAATTTLVGSLCLHGLGRFYGPQWRSVLPLADAVAGLRMSLGFDLTVVLSLVNCLLFLAALFRLKRTLLELEGPSAVS